MSTGIIIIITIFIYIIYRHGLLKLKDGKLKKKKKTLVNCKLQKGSSYWDDELKGK